MFIDDEAINIEVFYKKIGFHYITYNTSDFNELELDESEQKKFKQLSLKMRPLTWGLYNDLQESAMIEDGMGNRHFNYRIYKENRLLKLIISWNAITDEKPVKINPRALAQLAPDIAETILAEYDNIALIGDGEEKKS